MEATLIMLDKPILVNEEVTKVSDFILNGAQIMQVSEFDSHLYNKKILAGHEGTKRLTFQLSDEDANKIGYFDVDKICNTFYGKFDVTDSDGNSIKELLQEGFIDGANKILSLTPKKYTEKQLRDAILITKRSMGVDNDGETCYSHLSYEQIIQQVSHPQQFKVECTETENEIIVTKIL